MDTQQENILSLYELNLQIQNAINNVFYGKYFWVKAEIHKLNFYQYSGHAYPELLEKQENTIICQMKGIIWKSDLQRINQKFLDTIGEPIKENISALMLVSVKFDPRYGLSLQIKDIDPNYTLGELEKQKKQTIEKLKKENIFDLNKKLPTPLVIQKLAIISVETSKGYRDLITTFQKYEHRFNIKHDLYPSLLQGEDAAYQITSILNEIKHKTHLYDAVLIIRGGGGEVGLSCYNDYELCKTIATYPIPVITGIGHSTNFTVAEMVAHHNGITPTDTAMYIIQTFETFSETLHQYQERIIDYINTFFNEQKTLLKQTSQNISLLSKEIFHQQNIALKEYEQWLKSTSTFLIHSNHQKILQIANQIKFSVHNHFHYQKNKLLEYKQNIHHHSYNQITRQTYHLQNLQNNIKQNFTQILSYQKLKLNNLDKTLQLLHPNNTLKRGYAIVFNEKNQTISNPAILNENEKIKIKFHSSELEAHLHQLKIKQYE